MLAGATVDPLLNPIMFPWNTGDARYTAPINVKNPSPAQPTIQPNSQLVNTAQVGRAMRARTLLAAELLNKNRGSRPGATAADGMLGLVLMQQVIATEETLLSSVVFDGRALSSLPTPKDYQPSQGLRWLPARFRVVGVTQRASSPSGLWPGRLMAETVENIPPTAQFRCVSPSQAVLACAITCSLSCSFAAQAGVN